MFPGGRNPRKDSVWQRLVVPRHQARDHGATQRSVKRRPAVAVHRYGDRFAVVHVLSTTRVFPARLVRHPRSGCGTWGIAGRRVVIRKTHSGPMLQKCETVLAIERTVLGPAKA